MQTFLPFSDFADCAEVLDDKRLGKQRVETLQIMNRLCSPVGRGWGSHPVMALWRDYEWALLRYQQAMCAEWVKRTGKTGRNFTDTCYAKTFEMFDEHAPMSSFANEGEYPWWLGWSDLHFSHQSNLVRKDGEYYGKQFPGVPDNLPYLWPHSNGEGGAMPNRIGKNLLIQNADVIFRNFEGREGNYNAVGDRNFCIKLTQEQADDIRADGWNIKELRSSAEDEEKTFYVQVSVSYKNKPPHIVVISSKGRTELDEESLKMLDAVDIFQWDVMISPYNWEVNGNKGVKAYLKTAYVHLDEDELELKYAESYDDQDPTSGLSSSTATEEVAA